MDTSDVLKLVLGAVAALLLVRLVAGLLLAGLFVGTAAPLFGGVVLLPMVLVVGGLLALVVLAVGNSLGDGEDEALEELRRAYARGDLTDEEFERRRKRLQR